MCARIIPVSSLSIRLLIRLATATSQPQEYRNLKNKSISAKHLVLILETKDTPDQSVSRKSYLLTASIQTNYIIALF